MLTLILALKTPAFNADRLQGMQKGGFMVWVVE